MIKVFLVEDESVVREGLRDNIPWEQQGFAFVGEAGDGEMALPLIRNTRPDVLITDIKMPFMDGLALSKLVSRELPQTKIILISGHEDFELARQAIETGVEQYLLKPVTKTSMIRALAAVRQKIEEEKEQKDYLRRFHEEAREYEQFARKKFFEQITAGALSVQEIYEQADKLGLDLNAEGYNILLFAIQPQAAVSAYSEPLARLQDELMQYFLRYPEYILFRWNLMSYAVLIKGELPAQEQLTRRCLENIQRRCSMAQMPLDWYVAVSRPVQRLSELPGCFSMVNHIQAYRHLTPRQHILTAEVLEKDQKSDDPRDLESLDVNKADPMVIRSFLQTGLAEEVGDFVAEYLGNLGEAIHSMLFRQYLIFSVRVNAAIVAQGFGYDKDDVSAMLNPLALNLSAEELPAYLARIFRKVIELRDRESRSQYRDILKQALKYIDQNFADESISLNTVARTINISANYFSAVFSQEMGMTFVEYLTQKRMDKAKLLLRQSNKRSGEIAFEVGYKDPRYFSFIFRKTQGCTPRNYRAGEKA